MERHSKYRTYSDYLKEKYGTKVYKLPVNLPISCPNRKSGGCTFCAPVGTGFEAPSSEYTVREQLEKNKAHIASRYKATKFIAYFQNYTNTYMPPQQFKHYLYQVTQVSDIVEVSISTRPDCINDLYLEILRQFFEDTGINIHIELGLQTANYHTLNRINRGHGLAEYIDAVLRIARYKFTVCTHVILNLPWDDDTDAAETARLVSVLPVQIVKIHSLYIAAGSPMARQYMNHEFEICSKETYLNRLKIFVENLRPDIIIERLFSRIPESDAVFSNWGTSWWKLNDMFTHLMDATDSFEGKTYNYTNGPGLREFLNGKEMDNES